MPSHPRLTLPLGTAAVLVAGSALAQTAAPLPEGRAAAPQVQPVLACAALGSGFINIPGTASCLRIGLDVFPEIRSNFATEDLNILTTPINGQPAALVTKSDVSRTTDRYQQQPNGRVTLIAVTPLEGSSAPLVTFAALRSGFDDNAADQRARTTPGTGIGLEQGWVSAYGVTVGLKPSIFDYSSGYTYSGAYASQRNINQVSYEQRLGPQASVSVSLEDGRSRRYQDGSWALYGGERFPDLVLRGRYEPNWGSAHLAGALHPIHDDLSGKSTVGWAVNAGLEYKQDWGALLDAAKGMYGRILVTGAYSAGALDYLGIPHFNTDYVFDADGSLVLSKGFSGLVSYEHLWTSRFKTTATLALYRTTATLKDFDWRVQGGVAQVGAEVNPANGLYIGAELAYYFDQAQGRYFEVPGSKVPVDFWQAFFYLRRTI